MYENITYEELKNLPDEEKVKALTELLSITPDRKELAKKLGVAPIAIINLIGKYLEGKQIGRKKKETIEVENLIEEPKQKRKYTRKSKDEEKSEQPIQSLSTQVEKIIFEEKHNITISLNTEFTGSEIQHILTGISTTIFDNKKYKINLEITEI